MRLIALLLAILLPVLPALASTSTAGEMFIPDVYPSKFAAMRGLGQQAADVLASSGGFAAMDTIAISGNCCDEALASFASALKRVVPEINVVSDLDPATAPADVKRVSAEITVSDVVRSASPYDDTLKSERGNVTVTLRTDEVAKAISTRYVDKPWMDDWSAFAAADKSNRWIRGSGEDFAASDAHAMVDARRRAVDDLWPRVREQMLAKRSQVAGIRVEEPKVRQRLESLLREGNYVADQFVQTFDRPYGRVWQASLLVDASRSNIEDMARRCATFARAEMTAKAVTAGSMAGLFGVLFLTYLFVNTVTKGYFVWRLRAMALLAGIAGILIVLAIR